MMHTMQHLKRAREEKSEEEGGPSGSPWRKPLRPQQRGVGRRKAVPQAPGLAVHPGGKGEQLRRTRVDGLENGGAVHKVKRDGEVELRQNGAGVWP
jgi:hypothetical protein